MLKSKQVNYINFASLDSTNTWAKSNARILDPQYITCITAQEQTAGRGRFFRKWLSPKGQNIYATLYFQASKNASYLGNLSQIMSLSCTSVLREMGFSAQIKWPNDLLIGGKKIAGILCEIVSLDDCFGVVLGFGVNVNMSKELLDMIDQPATSLAEQSGHCWEIDKVLEAIVNRFIRDLDTLEKLGFAKFQKEYEELLAYKGQLMSWSDGVRHIKGICHSISEDGKLNLIIPSGEMISLSAGEIKAV